MIAETVGELIEMLKQHDSNTRLEGEFEIKWNNRRTALEITDVSDFKITTAAINCDVEDA